MDNINTRKSPKENICFFCIPSILGRKMMYIAINDIIQYAVALLSAMVIPSRGPDKEEMKKRRKYFFCNFWMHNEKNARKRRPHLHPKIKLNKAHMNRIGVGRLAIHDSCPHPAYTFALYACISPVSTFVMEFQSRIVERRNHMKENHARNFSGRPLLIGEMPVILR